MVSARARREQVDYAVAQGASVRRACALLQVSRSALRYTSRMPARDGDLAMELRQILGERLRQQRKALGVSQTDFATTTGIPVQVLSRLAHGRQSIWVERLADLAGELQVSTDYLVGLTDDPRPPKKRPRPRTAAPVG